MSYPIPTVCNYCKGEVRLVSNSVIYGKEFGNGKCYKCDDCDSYVGVHPDLITPLGILANKKLRELKKKAHSLFDPMWKAKGRKERNKVYDWMANKLQIPTRECHFGWFNKEMLLKAIDVLEKEKLRRIKEH